MSSRTGLPDEISQTDTNQNARNTAVAIVSRPNSLVRDRSANSSRGLKRTSSVNAMVPPRGEKKARPIGATGIGRHGAKYLVRSNGHSSAQPRPPSVMVSRIAWLASTRLAMRAFGRRAV